MEIISKDALRETVERESGGKQTVLYTAKGQATYMNIIPRFNLEELHPSALGTGIHPAFIVDGVIKDEIFIGTYQAVILAGEALSLPGRVPATSIDFDAARAACLAAGTGFHLMTNWEWAAIALWCIANGHAVRGNTNGGASHSHPDECGTRSDNGRITLTGTGPDSWRHDGSPYGIADLVGNVWEWVDGLKLANGSIVMPPDNNILLPETTWPQAGAAIDFKGGYPVISDAVTEEDWDSGTFDETAVKDGFEPPTALKQALLCPCDGLQAPGWFWADNTEAEVLPIRGGGWSDDSDAGLGALALHCKRSFVVSCIGFRPAFIG